MIGFMKLFTSDASIPDSIAELLSDPSAEAQLLAEVLRHSDEAEFEVEVRGQKLKVSSTTGSANRAIEFDAD
jgi:hypothetical protein